MNKFYSLKVASINKETADCVSLSLEIPADLNTIFSYKQGQYLTFSIRLDGVEYRRSYSICSNPYTDTNIVVAVKKVKDGKVSTYLNDSCKEGDVLSVMAPAGSFYAELNPAAKKNYVLFAGGSGITPMLSIIQATLTKEPQSTLSLFYGNRDEASCIFKNKLEALQSANPQHLKVNFIYEIPSAHTQPIFKGILNKEKLNEILGIFTFENQTEYFVCGPGPMMDNVVQALSDKAIDKKYIHVEYFTPHEEKPGSEASNQYVDSEMLLICDGDETMIHVKAGQNVLQAALDKNIDAPYSCRAGSCSTCRAKLIEGKVLMNVHYSLLDSEIEEGFILTCQAHPISPNVTVDYDRGR